MNRSPTFFERYYILRGEYDYYTNFNVSARYSRSISRVNLSNALRNLVKKYPCFAVSFFRVNDKDLEEDGKNFVMKPLQQVKFDDVVAFHKISKFDETTLEYIDQFVVKVGIENSPLWRIIVMEEEETGRQYLTFYCDHAIFDGTSGGLFHDKLLLELNEVESNQSELQFAENLHTLDDSFEIPHVNEAGLALYDSSVSFALYETASRLLVPGWIKNYISSIYQNWYPSKYYVDVSKNPMYRYKPTRKSTPTKFKLLKFSPAEVRGMLSRCKQNGLTLTPYVIVIALQCLQETIMKGTSQEVATSSESAPIEHSSETIIAINNRRFLPEAHAEEFGLMVSPVEVALPPFQKFDKLDDLFPTMAHVGKVMTSGIEANYGSKIVGLLKYVKVGDFLKEKLDQSSSRQTLDVSNLGNKSYIHGSWEAEEFIFSQSQGVGTHFGISLVSTSKSGLNIVFGYLEEYAKFQDETESFIKLYRQRLLDEDANLR
ncbi:hypothetical protein CLIB1423_10S03664 [[Candida] railenensis]|uniref:Alcohol acetyltransferase n=1 Tax=[Candida] railenensis TaxID=45579 RepID=A0A9P0VY71_9ASCO|nr:hypothetical protein CLIB1423_10S03664 [[Candida] railenensis]